MHGGLVLAYVGGLPMDLEGQLGVLGDCGVRAEGPRCCTARPDCCSLHGAPPTISAARYCLSNAAAKKPSVPCTCGQSLRRSPVSSAMRWVRKISAHETGLNCGAPDRKASTMASFSARNMLQVA